MLTGGIRTPSDALVGPVADLTIRSLHLDLLFLGCHGIDPVAGAHHAQPRGGGDQPGLHAGGPQGRRWWPITPSGASSA